MASPITQGFQAAIRDGMHSTPSMAYEEGATQAFKIGALLVDSGGYLIEGTAASPTGVVGVSLKPGSNLGSAGGQDATTGDSVFPVTPVIEGVEFSAQLDASSSHTAQNTHALAQTDKWTSYGTDKDSGGSTPSNFWFVNFSDTSNLRVFITRLLDPIGTVAGRVAVQFLQTATFTINS